MPQKLYLTLFNSGSMTLDPGRTIIKKDQTRNNAGVKNSKRVIDTEGWRLYGLVINQHTKAVSTNQK